MLRISAVTSVLKSVRAKFLEPQLHTRGSDINRLPGLPCLPLRRGAANDLIRIGVDSLPMKGRCNNLALAHVNWIVRGDQAFP